jgi:hypothetical protein
MNVYVFSVFTAYGRLSRQEVVYANDSTQAEMYFHEMHDTDFSERVECEQVRDCMGFK